MHLDTLSGFDQLKIGVAYELGGQRLTDFPPEAEVLRQVHCIYETMPGWTADVSGVRTFSELPQSAQDYILRLEQLLGARVSIVSVGPDRSQTIFR